MSWFSDLADRAENLLNKIDQNAAAVLQEKEKLSNSTHLSSKRYDDEPKPQNDFVESTTSKINFSSKAKNPLKGVSLKKSNKKVGDLLDSPVRSKYSSSMKQSNSFAHFTSINPDEYKEDTETSSLKDAPVSFDIMDNSRSSTPLSHMEEIQNDKSNVNGETVDNFVTIENELLKNEISVVNNEVSLLISKVKNAEKVAQESLSSMKQMESKYSQVQREKEILQAKINELENGAGLSQKLSTDEDLKTEIQDLQKRISNLEFTEMTLNSQKNELETSLKESQEKCQSLEERLERAKSELSNVQTEWKNYKIRANSALSMKEKLIEELGGNVGSDNDNVFNNLNSQIVQLKLERDDAIQEVERTQSELDKNVKEIESLESRLHNMERQYSILRDAFRQEKVAKEMAEHNINTLNKEMKSLQIETASQISSLRGKLRDNQSKENEHLCTQNSTASSNNVNVSENGEERLRLLTQALVAKQAALESVTSDRNALRMQLEKTETKYRADLIKMKNNQPRIINVNDTDDVKARFPTMMQENPWDSHLSRGAKKVYSTLDSFSVRVGVFLRRNPLARIFIISYMILLHLWVCIVLFFYTPEAKATLTNRRP